MKLILCLKCQDIIKLPTAKWPNQRRTCLCGACGGRYFGDGLNAEYWGDAIPIGFSNPSLAAAIKQQPESGNGHIFTAFVIPKKCPTMKKIDPPKVDEK